MANRGEPKMREAIRVAKFEVDSVVGREWKDANKEWFETMDMCRKAANLYYETWLVWHVQNDSARKMSEWRAKRREIDERFDRAIASHLDEQTEGGDLSKTDSKAFIASIEMDRKAALAVHLSECPVACISAPPKGLKPKGKDRQQYLSNVLYDQLTERFPRLNAVLATLLMQTLRGSLVSGKAASGSLAKWTSILEHNEGMPMFTKREFPIPFSCATATLVKIGDECFVDLQMRRVPVEGKSRNALVTDRIKLRMTGKSAKGQLTKFDKIASGEWSFKGSEFTYDKNNKKWFVNLCHQCPSQVESLNPDKAAYLIPGRNVPFYIRQRGQRKQWLQGRGHHITSMRERVWSKRSELNSGSKKSSSLRGGHGTKAAMKWRERWSRTWREFVKRINHHVSKDAVDYCVTNGIGTLYYCKPNGQCSENRCVSGDFKNSTWEFFDLQSKLDYKCKARGVKLVPIEFGKAESPQSK